MISRFESQNFKCLRRQYHFCSRTEMRPFCFVFTVHNSILRSTVCVVMLRICADYGHDSLCVPTSVCTDGLTETNQ
jgi:hypothetical protein